MKIQKNRYPSITLILLFIVGFTFNSCDNTPKGADMDKEDISIKSEKDKLDKNDSATKKSDAKKVEEDKLVYNLTQVDMPPLFDTDCLTSGDPQKCSEKKLFNFIKDNIVVPKEIERGNAGSLEQVIVVVNEDGSFSNMKYIASSNNKSCKTCQQAAADVIGKMENWKPAMKDRNPVSVQMTIPIKFNS